MNKNMFDEHRRNSRRTTITMQEVALMLTMIIILMTTTTTATAAMIVQASETFSNETDTASFGAMPLLPEQQQQQRKQQQQQRNNQRRQKALLREKDIQRKTIGFDICVCSPSVYEMTLNFNLPCNHDDKQKSYNNNNDNILRDAHLQNNQDSLQHVAMQEFNYERINKGSCLITGFSEEATKLDHNILLTNGVGGILNNNPNSTDSEKNATVTDLKPIYVSDIQFIEIGQNGKPVWISQETGQFMDGSIIRYTSVINELRIGNNNDNNNIPRTFQGRIIGTNSNGETLIFQFALTHHNDCNSNLPQIIQGDSIGWVVFNQIQYPDESLCPLIGSYPYNENEVVESTQAGNR